MKTKTRFFAISIIALIGMSILFASNTQYKKMLNDFIKDLLNKQEQFNNTLPEDRVYLHADKPMYKPGETIWFSAYVRNGKDLKSSLKSDIVHVELINPKGAVEKALNLIAKNGVAQGDFELGEEAVGGLYKIKTYTEWQKNDPDPAFFEKDIQVQKVVLPRLKMKLDFVREAYGAGDEVSASLSLFTNANQPLAAKAFDYVVNIDGNELTKSKSQTGSDGEATIRFQLPKKLSTNDGLVNVMIDYQGQTESIARSVPIVLNNIDLSFYPEGGDLVNQLEARVGFKAVDEFGEPADIEGVVLDNSGQEIAQFSSYHMGMGAFDLLPKTGAKYTAKITKPAGVKQTYELPSILKRGYGLEVVGTENEQLNLKIKSTENEELTVAVNVRGHNYAANTIKVNSGTTDLDIPLRNLPVGVAQVTLFDSKGIARAERLAFVNEDKKLQIDIKTDKEQYQPREKVTMTISVEDERGMPMPANLSIAVIDDQLLTFADDKSSNILSWLLMEADLADDVKEPNFYFDEKEEKATLALDYLLMTSGWRRFTWEQIDTEQPMANFSGERAVIAGQIVDAFGEPMPGAKIGFEGEDFKQKTNEQGAFSFRGINLYEGKVLEVTNAKGKLIRTLSVDEFNESLQIKAFPNKIRVTDENGEGLIAVNVILSGTNHGAITDLDGFVDISNFPVSTEHHNLSVQYIGYETTNVDLHKAKINKDGLINVEMKDGVQLLEMVVAGVNRRGGGRKKNMAVQPMAVAPQKGNAIPPPPPPAPEVIEEVHDDVFEIMDEEEEVDLRKFDNERNDRNVEDLKNEVAKPRAQIAEKNFEQDKDQGFMDGVVIDERIAFKEEEKVEEEPRIVYYRAKEFASPKYVKTPKKAERTDFRSTLYWNGNVVIDRKGTATLSFYTSDAITSFNIIAEGIASDGMVGRKEAKFFTQLPFSLSAKMPVEVVTEDVIQIPLTLVNNTYDEVAGDLNITVPKGLIAKGNLPTAINLKAKDATTLYLEFLVKEVADLSTFEVGFKSKGFEDKIKKELTIKPKGFPSAVAFSGQEMKASYKVNIKDPVKGSTQVTLTAYPSTVSELISGLESMLREPHGCFEQTSSSTYPNLLVLDYLQKTDQSMPKMEERALSLIKKGYQRLTSFESPSHGFEWFGGDPAHEGLTAYGLMEFVDMKKVYPGVDDKMIKRTTDWLLSRRDGAGKFKRNPRALHTFGLTDNTTMSAYIVWALSEAGIEGLKKEIDHAYTSAKETKNPYQLGLVANILYNTKDTKRAKEILDELVSLQLENGSWDLDAKSKSAPGSGGNAYKIETAGLALCALLKDENPHRLTADRIAQFLKNSRGGYGGFGNTNSTVLALRGLVAYAQFSKRTSEDGTIEFYVEGKKVKEMEYAAGTKDPIVLDGLAAYVGQGKQTLEVKFKGVENPLPYALNVAWNTTMPNSNEECVIQLKTELTNNKIKVGETVRLNTTLENISAEGQAMTIAIVGIPAGLSAQPWQLKELMEKKKIDFYEIIGNNVVFYFRQMKPSESKIIGLDLKAELAGNYDAPASTAYLYYTNEFKNWTSMQSVQIVAR